MSFDESIKRAKELKNMMQSKLDVNSIKKVDFGDGTTTRFSIQDGRPINESANEYLINEYEKNSTNNSKKKD